MQKLNPEGVHDTPGYHHVTIVSAGRLAFLAGQCPLDVDGKLVGEGDVLAQADQVAGNALAVLEAAGARPDAAARQPPGKALGAAPGRDGGVPSGVPSVPTNRTGTTIPFSQ